MLDLSLDRAYRDVVSFAETPSEITEIVNSLLSNRTELKRRSVQGKKFIELKVCEDRFFRTQTHIIQMSSTESLCQSLVSLARSIKN